MEDSALIPGCALADLLHSLRALSLLLQLIGHFYFTGRDQKAEAVFMKEIQFDII